MKFVITVMIVLLFVLSACDGSVDDPVRETPDPTETPVILPSPTATEKPPVVVTVCTTANPASLFPYDGETSASKARILSLLYPPAFEMVQGTLQSLILDKVPSQTDGDLRLEPVVIRRGQTVANVLGELVTAIEGVEVRPSGCREMGCAITWDGVSPLEMDQMVIEFRLRDGLTWSDGTPVTAGDSVFSFRLASAPDSPSYGWGEEHTQGFSAFDDRTLVWVGYPGFASADVGRFFWAPLPAHQFTPGAEFPEVAGAEMWRGSPVSYGSFVLAERGAEEMRLVRNPYDSTEGWGFPDADHVVMRVVEGGAQAGWDQLQSGRCDVLDESFRLAGQPALLAEINAVQDYELRFRSGDSWTQLVFGVRPVEYDALTNTLFATRPDYFGDVRTRQGIAACLDRPAMLALLDLGWGAPWPSFLSPENSRLDAGQGVVYDFEKGAALLEEAGWQDHDGDPSTARVAQGVVNLFTGTTFSVELLVGPSAFHQELAVIIQESLERCGLGVEVRTLSQADLYAPGPDGPLFGRNFDLALIAWAPLPGPDCGLYTDSAIPISANGWIGTNIAGFSDLGYDQACAAAALALPDEYGLLLARAEAAFVDLLPAVPLFAPPGVEVVADS